MIRALLVMTATVVLCTLLAGCSDSSSSDRAEHDKGPKQVPSEPMKPPSASVQLNSRGAGGSGSAPTTPTTPPAGGNTNTPGGGK